MIKQTKPQIPLEDRIIIDNLMFKVWKYDNFNALYYVLTILYRYDKLGFSTAEYKQEISNYFEITNPNLLYLSIN